MGYEELEKGRLIKQALIIVDELANSNLADVNFNSNYNDFDYETLQELINKAKALKRNRLWKLK